MKQWVRLEDTDGVVYLIAPEDVRAITYNPDNGTVLHICEPGESYAYELRVKCDLDRICTLLGITYRG